MHIYKFINTHDKVIYVGRTNNLIRRLRQEHFSKNGHLPESCYAETARVEYATVANINQAKTYELYYIEMYHPKYNQSDIGGGAFGFVLDDLNWLDFEFNTDKSSKTKTELLAIVSTFNQEIDTEFKYAEQLLRNQDTKPWLDKLTNDERNEHLTLVYSIERFIQNIGALNQDVKEKVT